MRISILRWTAALLTITMSIGCASSQRLPPGSNPVGVAEFLHRGHVGETVRVLSGDHAVEGRLRDIDFDRGVFVVGFDRSAFEGPDSLIVQFADVQELTVTDRNRSDRAVVAGVLVLGFLIFLVARPFAIDGGSTS